MTVCPVRVEALIGVVVEDPQANFRNQFKSSQMLLSTVVESSSGKFKGGAAAVSGGQLSLGKQHHACNLTGLTQIDYVALPAKARVSISYSRDAGAKEL